MIHVNHCLYWVEAMFTLVASTHSISDQIGELHTRIRNDDVR